MPIGVPKVSFQFPEDEKPTWVDLYDRLFHERILLLCKELTPEFGNKICGLITYLNIDDPTQNQRLYIHCTGGGIIPGIAVFDVMRTAQAEVHTIVVGLAASMASLILAGGQPTKRLAYPHARVMIHQPESVFFKDKTGGLILEAEEIIRMRDNIKNLYVKLTSQTDSVIEEDMARTKFMSATQARAYGIIDDIKVKEE